MCTTYAQYGKAAFGKPEQLREQCRKVISIFVHSGFWLPSYCCVPPFPENHLICSGTQLLLHPVECYRRITGTTRQFSLVPSCCGPQCSYLMPLCVTSTLCTEKGWKNLSLCHCPGAFCRFAVFSKGSCSPSSKNDYQAAQLSHWSLFWACACEMAMSGLTKNCSFPPHCIHQAFWLCCALKHYRGMSH